MASNFLEELKKAADGEEFNSEAAKKITDITKLAEEKFQTLGQNGITTDGSDLAKHVNKNIEEDKKTWEAANANRKVPTPEEVKEFNTEYDLKMAEFKKRDLINKQLAILIDIEEAVKLTIDDMFGYIVDIEDDFGVELKGDNQIFKELNDKIVELKTKYIL